jgi:hypothetical protein
MRLKKWLVLLSCLALLPAPAFAQFLGQVSIQTVQAQLAVAGVGAGTCTGNPQNFITNAGIANFSNIGQSIHQASATSTATVFTMEIDGIDVLGNVVRISSPTVVYQPTNNLTGYVSQGSGYYPNIQVTVTCTVAATFSLSYSGSTGGGGSAIIGTAGTNPPSNATLAADVQGMIPTGQNGQSIFPLLLGALDPAINLPFLKAGVDTFSQTSTNVGNGTTGSVGIGNPPTPSAPAGSEAIAFYGVISAAGSANIVAPWNCMGGGGCGVTGRGFNTAFLANYTTKNTLVEQFNNGGGGTTATAFVAFSKGVTIVQNNARSANNATLTVASGDVILVGYSCSGTGTANCGITSVTDTLTPPTTFTQIGAIALGNDPGTGQNVPITVYIGIAQQGASDTVTVNGTDPGQNSINMIDLRNVSAAPPNTPSTPLFISNKNFLPNEDDNGTVFTGNGAFDYTQSVTLTPAGTTTFPLWSQLEHGIFYSCTVALRVTAASGTTPTLDTFFQDSGDNLGFNDRMHFPQATTTGNFLGAVSGGVGGITPVATTDGVLAAATKVDGPLSAFGRIKFVVGGTTPSFTITYNVACR